MIKEMRVLKEAYGFTVLKDLETMKNVVTESNLKSHKLLADEIVDVEYQLIDVVDDVKYVKVLNIKKQGLK